MRNTIYNIQHTTYKIHYTMYNLQDTIYIKVYAMLELELEQLKKLKWRDLRAMAMMMFIVFSVDDSNKYYDNNSITHRKSRHRSGAAR